MPWNESIIGNDGANLRLRQTRSFALVHTRAHGVSEFRGDLGGEPGYRLPQPEMPRILIEARMPKQRDGEARQLDRGGAGSEPEGFGEVAREARWHGGDHRRAAKHEWHREEARCRHGDGALQLQLGERLVDRAARIVGEARQHVWHAQIIFERYWRRELELLGAEQAEEVV